MEPELIADYECNTGEGPMWHPDEERLYWVDIPNGRLFRYDPDEDHHEQVIDYDGAIGGYTIQENGDLLCFLDRGTIRPWTEDGGFGEPIVEEIPEERDSRFNDVIADPRGRVFCGTMPTADRLGRLYRLDHDGELTEVVEEVDVSNGLGFTPDREQMYYTESGEKKIYRYDYDEETGEISDRETFLDLTDEEGVPDGMTVDAEGYVWSARWDGGCLVRYDSDGTETRRVEFPARKVSSVTFGGPDYEDAYVTTALGSDDLDDRETEGQRAGALFRVDLGVQGVEEFRSRIEY